MSDALRGVLVSHPSRVVGVYHEALALQQAGLLRAFVTGFYFDADSKVALGLQWLPSQLKKTLFKELRRRGHYELDPKDVVSHPLWDLILTLVCRAGLQGRTAYGLLAYRNEMFEKSVAADIRRIRPAGAICYDSASTVPFEACDEIGAIKILDQVIGHIQAGVSVADRERTKNPEFADSFPIFPEHGLVDKCTAEIKAADHILAPSDYVVKTLVAAGADPNIITLFPYGVDTERFCPSNQPRDENGVFEILYAGQISQRKGIKYLLQAFQELNLPNARLTLLGRIVGSGEGLSPFEGVFRHVPEIAYHEMPDFYRQADVFVFPSLHEGSANVTYEALASGLPVITTFESGSVIRDGIEGFIVPSANVEALKERIVRLMKDRELRRCMALAARRRAEEFTWGAFRQRLVVRAREWTMSAL